jgi:hypothetical protein
VRGVDFDVYANEVLCIVGESGSGKSVTSLAVTGLLPETARVSGSIRLGDIEVIGAAPETLRQMRGRDVGFIFQDPTTDAQPGGCRLAGRSPRGGGAWAARQGRGAQARGRAAARSGYCRSRGGGSPSIRTSFPAACGSGR